MNWSKKLNEILSNTKTFGDEHDIGYDEWISTSIIGTTKFVNSTNEAPKLKSGTIDLKGKLVVSI